jgi:hypothetical protein
MVLAPRSAMRVLSWLVVALSAAGCGEESVPQSTSCAAFVACIEAIDAAESQTTNLDRYVEGGACWDNQQIAGSCATSCERTLERMRTRVAGLPAECM